MEAEQKRHLLTHRPSNPNCTSCMRGKMRQVHHRRGAFSRPVERWGDIITCDHMVQTDEDWNMGLNGMRDALTVKDIATGLTWAYPTASKSGDDTMEALM